MIPLLRRFLRPYRAGLVLVLALLLVQAIGNLMLPSLNADIINDGVVTGDTGYIVTAGLRMLLVAAVVGVAAIVGTYHSARIAMGFGRDVRAALFRTVQTFSMRELNAFGAASLITRTTNDVQQVQQVMVAGLTMMVLAPITVIGGIVMAVRENATLSGLLLIILPLMVIVISLILRVAVPLFRQVQLKIDRINQVLRENLTGIRVIRAFVRTDHEIRRFDGANADLTGTTLKVTRIFAMTMPTLMLIINLSSVSILWFGGKLIDAGDMPIGDLTAFLSYMVQILFSVMMAVMAVTLIPRAAASSDRMMEVLRTVPTIVDREGAAAAATTGDADAPAVPAPARLPERGVRVELAGVSFGYPGAEEPILRDVDLVLEPGTTTAVVGSTGSGKTTLVNLLPRLFDVTAGSISFDGTDVRDLPQAALRERIGLVPQRSFLFSGTVADNLRHGRADATDEDLWHALTVAQAKDVVEGMPGALEAPVEQGGGNLSGGQRQRIAIARALVRRPQLYLFDDSFSALDFATDARLRAALRADTRTATVVIVAQRVSTVMTADRIMVLDRGRVVGVGSHRELLADCPTYQEIVSSQLTEEESA